MKKVLVVRTGTNGSVTDAYINKMKNEVSRACKSEDIELAFVDHASIKDREDLLIKYIEAAKLCDTIYFANMWADSVVARCIHSVMCELWFLKDDYYAPENSPGLAMTDK